MIGLRSWTHFEQTVGVAVAVILIYTVMILPCPWLEDEQQVEFNQTSEYTAEVEFSKTLFLIHVDSNDKCDWSKGMTVLRRENLLGHKDMAPIFKLTNSEGEQFSGRSEILSITH